MILRLSVIGIGLIYAVFLLLFLAGRGFDTPHKDTLGILVFGLFVLSLVLHVTFVVSARSWAAGIIALISAGVLMVSLFWVLHRITGDSL